MVPEGRWSVCYRDGSANMYTFEGEGARATFAYDPVRPEESSTGLYSGGEPRAGELEATELWQRVIALEAATALHTPDRAKGTGAFTLSDARGTRDFIIVRGPELLAFDAFVKAL